MIQTTFTCDRCGKSPGNNDVLVIHIKSTHITAYADCSSTGMTAWGDSRYELCHACQRELNSWCKNGKKP